MIKHCKICLTEIPTPKLGADWWCPQCRQYSIVCLSNGIIESETIGSSNYYLTYFPTYKTASIAETNDLGKRILKSFEMEDLTHEQAVKWRNKLQTYVLFQ
jgi:hypothetical protein